MTRRLHSIAVCYGPPDEDAPENEVLIYYTFVPGQPERGPTYACGGTPAEPPEVELDHVEDEDNGTARPIWNEWAAAYLQGAGYDSAVEQACEDLEPDPDAAYEERRERLWMERNQ